MTERFGETHRSLNSDMIEERERGLEMSANL
jgi:hypothetical protein